MKATLYAIDGPWTGHFAIVPRPRGDDWLEDEARDWRVAGLDIVISALTPEEESELKLENEAELCRAQGIEFVSCPITDRGVPASARGLAELLDGIARKLGTGKKVGIHCRQGVGRSALLAACLLVREGISAESAFDRIAAARGCPVPDTTEQRAWVARFAQAVEKAHAVARVEGK